MGALYSSRNPAAVGSEKRRVRRGVRAVPFSEHSDVPRSPVCSDIFIMDISDIFIMILKMYEKYELVARTLEKVEVGAERPILTPHLECIALQDMAPAHP